MFYVEKTYSPQDQADIIAEVIEGLGFYIKDHQPEAVALLERYSIATDGSGKQMADAYVEKLFGNDKKFYNELISELMKYDLIDVELFKRKKWLPIESNDIDPVTAIAEASGEILGGLFGIIKTGQQAGMQKQEMKARLLAMLYGTKEAEKQEQRSINTIITATAVILIILFILMLFYLTVIKPKSS